MDSLLHHHEWLADDQHPQLRADREKLPGFIDYLGRLIYGLGGWPRTRWEDLVRWAQDCEALPLLEARLPGIFGGKETPAKAAECLAAARLCFYHQQYRHAARLYQAGFAKQPFLARAGTGQRYDAARAAALAGCDRGKDAEQGSKQDRAGLRRQALAWLRADLVAHRWQLGWESRSGRIMLRQTVCHWQQDLDLAGVRDGAALSRLPESEQGEWRKLWQEVEALKARIDGLLAPSRPAHP